MTRVLFIFLLIFLFPYTKSIGQQSDVYIKAGLLYDSKSNQLLPNKIIHIQGSTIKSITGFRKMDNDKKVIDLSDYTVLPGLIDAHTHVLFSQEANEDFAGHSIQTLTMESDALRALRGAKRAESYLEEGITSIKDLGNSGLYLDVALRDAINEGTIEGPRIFAAGPILSAVGGQVYGVTHQHQNIIDLEYRIIKSSEDAKNAVREHINQNVDLIKICADNLPNKAFLTVEEMSAIVEMAHSYDLTVTAHCITNESARNAIEAGVDGIEHGFNLTDSTLTLMAEKKIFLVPTENSRSYMETYAKLIGDDLNSMDWVGGYINKGKKRLMTAIEKGVPIVSGSDNYTKMGVSRGKSSKDMLRNYFEAGMKPLDILQSATYISAMHLNKEMDIGTISPMAYADIIAVKGNLENDFISTMDNVVFVMKDGKVYKNNVNPSK